MILEIYRWICTIIVSGVIIHEAYISYLHKLKDFKEGETRGTLAHLPKQKKLGAVNSEDSQKNN